MTLDSLIILSGAFVALLPFLGFPNSWDTVLFALVGVFIVALGIVVRRRGGSRASRNNHNSTFSESAPGAGEQSVGPYRDEHATQ